MKNKTVPILILCLVLTGCASMEKSVLLGAGIGGGVGGGIGTAAGNNLGGALLGLGIGAAFGGLMGYAGHKDKEERDHRMKGGNKKEDASKVPSLTAPEVRRVWVPERIEGGKFIEGHYMYVIERNSVWSR